MDVEFDEPKYESNRVPGPELSAFSKFFIRIGLASDNRAAQRIMLVLLILVLLVLGLVLLLGFEKTPAASGLEPLEQPLL
jgi:hypothetical protein